MNTTTAAATGLIAAFGLVAAACLTPTTSDTTTATRGRVAVWPLVSWPGEAEDRSREAVVWGEVSMETLSFVLFPGGRTLSCCPRELVCCRNRAKMIAQECLKVTMESCGDSDSPMALM